MASIDAASGDPHPGDPHAFDSPAVDRGLSATLTALARSLDPPDKDLARMLDDLGAALARAVPSYLGLSVSIMVGGHPFMMTTLADPAPPRPLPTSLRIPLSNDADAEGAGETGHVLVVYAEKPGALVDLAADVSWALDRHLTVFELDAHRDPPEINLFIELHRFSVINQAVGVLLQQGQSPGQARRSLAARAAATGNALHSAAQDVVDAAAKGRTC